MDKILSNLKNSDAGLFKNGILYDRVYNSANLVAFNQNDTSNRSNYSHFLRAWDELHNASLNPQFTNSKDVEIIAYSFQRNDVYEIGLINMDFTMIKEDALDPKQSTINNI